MITFHTIYDRPADFPEHVVVRPHTVNADRTISPGVAQIFDTLAQAREAVAPGRTRIPRSPEDVDCLLESWME